MHARIATIASQGLELRVHEWGAPDAPPVVLLHGLRAYGYWFEEFAEAAQDRFRLIALDQRGRGASSWAPLGRYTTGDYVADVIALVDQLKLSRHAVVGHSMGGTNALAYAATRPAGLEALVIVDSAPELDRRGLVRISEEVKRTPASFASSGEAREFLRTLHTRCGDQSLDTRLAWMLREGSDGRLHWRIDSAIFDPNLRLDPPQAGWERAALVTCPTLVVRGTESDLVTFETADRFAAAFAQGSRAEVEHAAHMVVEDNPAGFNAAVLPFLEATMSK